MRRTEHEDDPRWQLVERIAASRSFGRSSLLVDFLFYVSDRQIRGRDSEITEQQIGVQVFSRPASYNSNDDNIVRNYARTLRKRLEQYFATEGRWETLSIEVPRGGYVPVFSTRRTSVPSAAPLLPGPITPEMERESTDSVADNAIGTEKEPSASPFSSSGLPVTRQEESVVSPKASNWALRIAYVAASLTLLFLGSLGGYLAARSSRSNAIPSGFAADRMSRRLWNNIFDAQRDTFLVPADGGLVMMQSFTRQHVLLPDFVKGTYRNETEVGQGMDGLIKTASKQDQNELIHKVSTLASRRYTSIVDLDLSTQVARLPEVVPERLMIRYARDLRIDDLRNGNAILLGSSDANPWVSLFEPQLNFQFVKGTDFGGSGKIVNRHPLPGEQESFASVPKDPQNQTFGLIAYVPNLEGSGRVLIIEGVNMAGTQAAGAFLLNPEKMRPVLARATNSNGKIQPFELLISTSDVAANASQSKILSERIGTL